MNTDTLRETFRELEAGASGLDPERVIAGARRRGVRRIVGATAAASLGTAAAVVAGFAVAGSLTDASAPSVADRPTPIPTVIRSPGVGTTSRLTLPPVQTAPPGPSTVEVPGRRPVISDGSWVKVSAREWFSISGRTWSLMDRPGRGNGISDTVDATTMGRGWTLVMPYGQRNDWNSFSLLRGDIRRVVYTAEGPAGWARHEARVFRLESMPGWVIAQAAYRVEGDPGPHDLLPVRVSLDAYDGSGKRVLHCGPPPYATSKTARPKAACTTG